MQLRTILTAAAACTAIAVAAPLASAAPKPTVVSSVNGTCTIAKLPGLTGVTKVKIKGSELAASFLDMTGCDSAYAIVKKASVMEMPFSSNGFQCTPSMVSTRVGKWSCVFQAADSSARITQTFTANYTK